jgi:hypothetical protein
MTTASAAAPLTEFPVTAARNSDRPRLSVFRGSVAVIVAVRGTSRRSAISPK